MVRVKFLNLQACPDHVGFLPGWLSEHDALPAARQFDAAYSHGGGWSPFPGFRLLDDNSIKYPGDPPLKPLAEMHLRDELILVYESAWVAIIQPDRSYEICRMD